jgi:hypothetical protein
MSGDRILMFSRHVNVGAGWANFLGAHSCYDKGKNPALWGNTDAQVRVTMQEYNCAAWPLITSERGAKVFSEFPGPGGCHRGSNPHIVLSVLVGHDQSRAALFCSIHGGGCQTGNAPARVWQSSL